MLKIDPFLLLKKEQMTRNSLFEILEWDTQFFGIKIAKINDFKSEEEFYDILNEIKRNKIKLLYFFIEPDDIYRNSILLKNNAILVDEKITYKLNIENIHIADNFQHIKFYSNNELTQDLINISIQTSEFSRFRIDKNIGDSFCDKLYTKWIENAVNKHFNDAIYVYSENGRIEGLVTLKSIADSGSISLIGVDAKSRGKNIGTLLIKKSIVHYQEMNINYIEVVTQKANALACKFYEKNGFTIQSIKNIYHLWV